MDIQKIQSLLPHRYPFLLLDRVVAMQLEPEKKIVAIKNVSINEPFFTGHFPGNPVMPGVLIIEAMAQAGAVLLLHDMADRGSKLVYFTGIDKARFRRPVVPGDQIRFELEVLKLRARTCKMRGRATVEGELAAEAEILSVKVLKELLGNPVDDKRFRYHNYPVNQLFGVQNSFPSFMQSTHQVHTVGDAEDYVSRLDAVGMKFDQVLEGLRRRDELGIHPPQFVVTKVLEEMRGFIATPPEEGILMVSLLDKMDRAGLAESEQERVAQTARAAIEQTVYPAYGRLIDHFVALDAKVDGNYGAWSLPDGDAYYRLALRLMTTTDYDPAA